jgi:hypothetical protein
MKKQLLFISYIFISLFTRAQPILTGSNSNLVVGEINSVALYNWVAPGNSGANQNWNFSSITTGTNSNIMNFTITTIPSTILAQYPNANIVLDYGFGGNIYKTSSAEFQTYGTYNTSNSNNNVVYQDPMDILRYPFSFNSTYTDIYSGTQGISGSQKFSKATYTVTADGYGTLSLPIGSFSNVLRIHTHTIGKDSTNASNQINFMRDEYRWYLPNNHYPLLQNTIGTYGISNYKDLIMLNNISTSLSEKTSSIKSFNLYPNPNNGQVLNLDLNLTENTKYQIAIIDNIGREVLKTNLDQVSEGYNFRTIDVSGLECGIYNVEITLENGNVLNKKFNIQK